MNPIKVWQYSTRLFMLVALLLLASHFYVLWGVSHTEGWGALGWASALQFNYFASAILGLIGIAGTLYGQHLHKQNIRQLPKRHQIYAWTTTTVALLPFFHMTLALLFSP